MLDYTELRRLSIKVDEALALAARLDQDMAVYLLRMVSLEVSERIENLVGMHQPEQPGYFLT
jgi:hypothetical protein